MKVRELIQWLSTFEDQDATVEVVEHSSGANYYEQGGSVRVVPFDPDKHTTYTDLRGNPYVKADSPSYGSRTLLLGDVDG